VLCGGRFESVVTPCWAEDPAVRPDFTAICTSIQQFRSAATAGDDYYAVDGRETYTNVF